MRDDHEDVYPLPPWRRAEVEILAEASDSLALILWQTIRHVRDWLDSSPGERKALFPNPPSPRAVERRELARRQAPELDAAWKTFDAMLRQPVRSPRGAIGTACSAVAAWAVARGYRETSIHYAEAAAVAFAALPDVSVAAGRVCREAGELHRAEAWFRRGIELARQNGQWIEYIRAHLGLGLLFMRQGRAAEARRLFSTAASRAKREGYEWLAAEAQHDLFRYATVHGDYEAAEESARKAFEWYPKSNQRLPYFAADVAFLLVCQGVYAPAATLLRPALKTIPVPDRILALALYVRAVSAVGEHRKADRLRTLLYPLLARHGEYEAAARWHLAEAARAAGKWELAVEDARRALELAAVTQDSEAMSFARDTLEACELQRSPPPFAPPTASTAELVNAVVERLASWEPTRRGRPRSLPRGEWST